MRKHKPLAVDLSTPEELKRKEVIVTELYSTGRLNGLYFGVSAKNNSNPVKYYIKSALFKNYIPEYADLIDDCYNEAFMYLYEMTAAKVCAMYDEAPDKVIATLLRIIAWKCFAKDPKRGNPNHSLVRSCMFGSVYDGAVELSHQDKICLYENINPEEDVELGVRKNADKKQVIKHHDYELTDFEEKHGFTPEDIIEKLTPRQAKDFYFCINRTSKRNLEPSDNLLRKEVKLYQQVIDIASRLS